MLFMHDNAKPHASRHTAEEMTARGITVIPWPPYSPDLNPIEKVWNKMKDYLQQKWPQVSTSYDVNRRRVTEAWNEVGRPFLRDQIESIH